MSAQTVYAGAGFNVTDVPLEGASDTETDYAASFYYFPSAYGYLWINGSEGPSGSGTYNPNDPNQYGCVFGGYFCVSFPMTFPNSPQPSTDYEVQTNAFVIPYYWETVNSTIVFEDVDGFSEVNPGSYSATASITAPGTSKLITYDAIYVGSVYYYYDTPEAPPLISGVEVNGAVTNAIIAGTSGYIAIYGTHLDNLTNVTIPGSGITITSYQSYNAGAKVNAFFQASSATSGTDSLTVTTTHGNASSTVTVVKIAVTKVQFTGTNVTAYSRDCSGNSTAITTPTWPAPTTTACPISANSGDAAVYAAGSVISGTVTFSMSPSTSQAISGVRIQGVAPGIGNFVASGVTLPANSLVTAAIPFTSDTALTASQTQFFSPETVTWDVSQNGAVCGSGCASAGTSTNPIYVTLAPSVLPSGFAPLMLTYVSLAVGNGGATSATAAVAATWSKFATGSVPAPANVKTWDNRVMSYYQQGIGFQGCAVKAALLVESNGSLSNNTASGQCGAFALLLESALAANGLHSSYTEVAPADGVSLLVIDTWTLSTTPAYPSQAPWEYELILNSGSDYMYPVVPSFGNLTEDQGLPGQSSVNPSEKVFNWHYIVQYPAGGALWYDPSYGVTYSSAASFETQSIQGYAKQINETGAGHYHFRPGFVFGVPPNISFIVISQLSM